VHWLLKNFVNSAGSIGVMSNALLIKYYTWKRGKYYMVRKKI